jgi:hypothetical protein
MKVSQEIAANDKMAIFFIAGIGTFIFAVNKERKNTKEKKGGKKTRKKQEKKSNKMAIFSSRV